jgi:transposase, IS6 family
MNNWIEADHGRLNVRLRPMRAIKRPQPAMVVTAGHAIVQNLRRGQYELGVDVAPCHRVAAAFNERTAII